jgi:predicted transcriptional regulator
MNYQVMPEMSPEEYEALKEDIAERGVMIPIEFDEDDNVLDGHHRLKICDELGINDYPKIIRKNMSEAEKWTHARKLNMARRHLTREQRRELILSQIQDTPEFSDRQIAKILGVSNSTVSLARRELAGNEQVCESHTSLDKYAMFTVEEYEAIRNYISIETDTDKLINVKNSLLELMDNVKEVLIEAEIKFNELIDAGQL